MHHTLMLVMSFDLYLMAGVPAVNDNPNNMKHSNWSSVRGCLDDKLIHICSIVAAEYMSEARDTRIRLIFPKKTVLPF